jgi:hypothetical protein
VSDDYLWDPQAKPDPDVVRLEALLRPAALQGAPLQALAVETPSRRRAMKYGVAAAAVLVAAVALVFVASHRIATPWAVAAVRGTPTVQTATGDRSSGALVNGGVLETDARSSAELNVGRIGRAQLGPGSRLRILDTGPSEHRLALDRGTLHASVDAPPRYFLVETPSALAVDLGCVYSLEVDARGAGLLIVEEGEVELQSGTTRSSVLAGNAAALRPNRGPGLPYPVDGSVALRRAVAAYDAAPSDAGVLDSLLIASDARSTITLWHLLQRVDAGDRGRVYDRLAALAPTPATVLRDKVLRGESGALQRWRTDLQRTWVHEPSPWRRVWRAITR